MKDQKLVIALSGDPAESPLGLVLWRNLQKFVAARGAGEALTDHAGGFICDMLANDPADIIECVAAVAPGTGNLVLRFGISDRLGGALAAAAQDFDFKTAHQKLHH
ncbi:hypothetical protein [Blastomonas sp. CCH5-A3]|jgi:hypothetical protein|uniref:hypothetical protein n=1 Tax=Blastomonas sp. CCH5-A3 TaxID=1768761 RepID=UPI000824F270|nr:hypothetical protein [Blastomonas sp. CCH5-A3]MAF60224.1 hypothetical protein [Blastomonas sp.]|tara:strand:+ start:111091 stop:111408 length:318 start_codon:yes stop_codon:yes gene_type:complete